MVGVGARAGISKQFPLTRTASQNPSIYILDQYDHSIVSLSKIQCEDASSLS